MKTENQRSQKELNLYIILGAFFLTNALIAELVGVKIFSLEKTLGFSPSHLPFWGGKTLAFNMSVGILIWPFVFIISDIINEYFGKSGVKKLSYLAAILIAYSFIIIFCGIKLQPADFWLHNNNLDLQGKAFDINFAYAKLFGQSMGIIAGSITAFLVSQLIDLYAFHYIRKNTGHKKLWLRATGSTAISQFIDSFLILIIAFYWFGNWSLSEVLSVGVVQYCYKVILAILFTPLIYWLHCIIDRYLGHSLSDKLIENAEQV